MPKQSKNLSLDPEAIRRGERYGELHRTSVSQLVNHYLASLPIEEEDFGQPLSPAVRRLLGIGLSSAQREDYHHYLLEKYTG